jgi:hypothetical protein
LDFNSFVVMDIVRVNTRFSQGKDVGRFLLHLLLIAAVLTGTMPCSCWAALRSAPKSTEEAGVTIIEEDVCPCCRPKKAANDKQTSTPEQPSAPKCPPGCFTCLGAVTSSPMIVPILSFSEPAMDDAVAMHIPLAPQQAIDQMVPPPRTAL